MRIGTVEAILKLRDEFTGVLGRASTQLAQHGEKMKRTGRQISEAGERLTTSVSLPVALLGGFAIKTAKDFETSFAGIVKTVSDATDEMGNLTSTGRALQQGMRDLAKEMPVNVNELNRIGEAAGQLGIESENILGFTEVMAKLGVTTNLTADQAATSLARLANITQLPQSEFDRLGSTIVALGNNFATTEAEIVEMGLRIAGAGKQIGLTEGQILAFSTALSSVGIEAEAGGSAISRVMINIALAVSRGGKELQQFASVSGQSSQEFRAAFQQDAASAINSFIAGLGRMQESGGNVLGVLEEMGITETRMRDALLRAAGAGDLLTRSLQVQATAWEENTALTKEAAQRFKTFDSQLAITWNQLKDVGITLGTSLMPVLRDVLSAMRPIIATTEGLARTFANLPKPVRVVVAGLGGLAIAAGPVLVVTGKLIESWGIVVGVAPRVAKALTSLITPANLLTFAFVALALAINNAITKAREAMQLEIERMVGDANRAGLALQNLRSALSEGKISAGVLESSRAASEALGKSIAKVEEQIEKAKNRLKEVTADQWVIQKNRIEDLEKELRNLGADKKNLDVFIKLAAKLPVVLENTETAGAGVSEVLTGLVAPSKATEEALAAATAESRRWQQALTAVKAGMPIEEVRRLVDAAAKLDTTDLFAPAVRQLADLAKKAEEAETAIDAIFRARNLPDLEIVVDTSSLLTDQVETLRASLGVSFSLTMDELIGVLAEAESMTRRVVTAEETRLRTVARAKTLYDKGLISAETFNRVLRENADTFKVTEKAIRSLSDQLLDWADVLGHLGELTGSRKLQQAGGILQGFVGAKEAASNFGSAYTAYQEGTGTGADAALALAGGVLAWATLFLTIADTFTDKGGKVILTLDEAGKKVGVISEVMGRGANVTHQVKAYLDIVEGALNQLGGVAVELGRMQVVMKEGQAWVRLLGGGILKFGEDLQGALEFATIQAIKSGEFLGLSENVKTAIENSVATTFEEFWSDINLAKEIDALGFEAPEVARRIQGIWTAFRTAIDQALDLGLDAANLIRGFAASLTATRNEILGIQEDPAERIRRQAATFSAQRDLVEAEARLAMVNLERQKRELETEADFLAAELHIGQARLTGRQALLEAEAGMVAAELQLAQVVLQALEVVDAALASYQAIIDSLPARISDEEIQDAINRLGRAGAGAGSTASDLERLGDQLDSLARDRLPAARKAVAEFDLEWLELRELAHGNAAALARLNEEMAIQRRLLVEQLVGDFYTPLVDFEAVFTTPLGEGLEEIRTQAEELRDGARDLAEALGFSGERLARMLERITEAEQARITALATEGYASLLGEVANLIQDDKLRSRLLQEQARIEFILKLAQYEREFLVLQALGVLTEAQLALLREGLDWINANQDKILASVTRPIETATTATRDLSDAASKMAERLARAKESITDFLLALQRGEFGGKSNKESFDEAFAQFQKIREGIRGGNIQAAEDFPEFARTLLDLARQRLGSTDAFQTLLAEVRAAGVEALGLDRVREDNVVFDARFFDLQSQHLDIDRAGHAAVLDGLKQGFGNLVVEEDRSRVDIVEGLKDVTKAVGSLRDRLGGIENRLRTERKTA